VGDLPFEQHETCLTRKRKMNEQKLSKEAMVLNGNTQVTLVKQCS